MLQRLQSALAGRYNVVREVARGGMGTIFEAQDQKHHRPVAIKVLNPDLAAAIGAERFKTEIQTAAGLTHPHIVPLHDSGEADGLLYYVMPLIAGETLRERLRRERQLPIEDSLRIARDVGDALSYAHAQGLIHRDVKPENILLSGAHALVLDFGIARTTGMQAAPAGSMTQTLAVAGTPTYMSPEQTSGAALDARSDQYSLACVLYEMLAGQPPFTGASPDSVALQHRTVDPRPVTALRPTTPSHIAQVIARSLAKAPADRYATIAAFTGALAALPTPAPVPTPSGARRDTPTPSGLPGGRVMLAILPLENLSADPEQEFFTDGMTEELIAHMGRLQPKRLGVIARTSAMRYKKTTKSVDEIGRDLGVDHILEGSVRRAGERVRITVQLIQVADQTHLWAENYDRRMADVFDLQSEVAASVAKALEVELLPSGQARGSAGAVASTAAYEAYLKGRYHWSRRTREGFRLAVEWFERAIAEDPGYARAYAGLADVYLVMPAWGLMRAPDAFAKAEPYVRRALERDPNLAEAHASYGALLSNKYTDFTGAERELRRAIELDPGYTTAHYWLGTSLSAQDKLDEAEAAMERSRQMDPLSVIVAYNLASLNFRRRRYDRALDYFRETLELDPAFLGAYLPMAQVHACRGSHDEGIAFLSGLDVRARQSLEVTAGLGLLHARAGHADEARAILRDLAERAGREYVAPAYTLYTVFALGERDEALRMLERGLREGEVAPFFIQANPMWDMIREDERFVSLVRTFAAGESGRAPSGGLRDND